MTEYARHRKRVHLDEKRKSLIFLDLRMCLERIRGRRDIKTTRPKEKENEF